MLYAALALLFICAGTGVATGSVLARRSRRSRAALPVSIFIAAACALTLGYLASNEVIAALQNAAQDYGLRLEVGGGYASLRDAVMSPVFFYAFPVGLVVGQLGAWIAHRRLTRKLALRQSE